MENRKRMPDMLHAMPRNPADHIFIQKALEIFWVAPRCKVVNPKPKFAQRYMQAILQHGDHATRIIYSQGTSARSCAFLAALGRAAGCSSTPKVPGLSWWIWRFLPQGMLKAASFSTWGTKKKVKSESSFCCSPCDRPCMQLPWWQDRQQVAVHGRWLQKSHWSLQRPLRTSQSTLWLKH